MPEDQSQDIATQWVAAWNTHDLEKILSHYSDDIELISPIAERLVENSSGKISGIDNLASYFRLGLQAYPDLHFRLLGVMQGVDSLVIHYINQADVEAAEYMQVDPQGKIQIVIAHYQAGNSGRKSEN